MQLHRHGHRIDAWPIPYTIVASSSIGPWKREGPLHQGANEEVVQILREVN